VSETTTTNSGPGAYGERDLTLVDRFGVWLSARRLRREAGGFSAKRVGDFGCGYEASFVRTVLDDVASVTLVDVSLAPDLQANPKVRAIEGVLPDALRGLESASFDVVMCVSVLEHLVDPQGALDEFHRVLAPGGVCLLNVPSWRGKRMLELSAFRLHLSPPESIDDHKTYYDPKDLWPLLVKSGFRPSKIKCHRYKFGLNTFAVCRRGDALAS
jgi:SAM-dependent methyltransferase